MFRRILQFALLLAVVASASLAQPAAMPCCQTSHVGAIPSPAAVKNADAIHCHGNMHHADDAISVAPCASPICDVQADVATTPADDAMLMPIAIAASDALVEYPAGSSETSGAHGARSRPPDLRRQASSPLRV